MHHTTLPSFPDNVCTYPLLIIDFDLLKAGDAAEIDRLWEVATSIGFWYLKNHGADTEVNSMFDVGANFMALPLEEKLKYETGDEGGWFGYKKAGANAVDATGGQLDTAEFLNIFKDDALAFPKVVYRTYPTQTMAEMGTVVRPFVRKSVEVNNTIIRIFNAKLGLPEDTLEQLHLDEEHSASGVRMCRVPPMAGKAFADRPMLGSHTDFGSLSFLHNRLGGLQVLPPDHTGGSMSRSALFEAYASKIYSRTYDGKRTQPLPGHAICNIGDALAIFSGGILQSNIHRVVPPPGDQGEYERWSIVFFTRPGNSRVLRAFVEDSPLIADAVQKTPERNFDTGETAADWFTRRVKYMRINNRKGPETWAASRGTEHDPNLR